MGQVREDVSRRTRRQLEKVVNFDDLGDLLFRHAAAASDSLLLVAPFVKAEALERVLRGVSPQVQVTLVTRWRLDEIAIGVSDVDAYSLIAERNGSVWLLNRLHAKYFRADQSILSGSANLTLTALGWVRTSNLEVITETMSTSSSLEFEQKLFAEALQVDDALAGEYLQMQQNLRTAQDEQLSETDAVDPPTNAGLAALLPRDPEVIWRFYNSPRSDILSTQQKVEIGYLLEYLGVPPSVHQRNELEVIVGSALWLETEVREFHAWLDNGHHNGRRFGEITQRFTSGFTLDKETAEFFAQTLIRNLVYFLPNKFVRTRPRHSEIISQRRQ